MHNLTQLRIITEFHSEGTAPLLDKDKISKVLRTLQNFDEEIRVYNLRSAYISHNP